MNARLSKLIRRAARYRAMHDWADSIKDLPQRRQWTQDEQQQWIAEQAKSREHELRRAYEHADRRARENILKQVRDYVSKCERAIEMLKRKHADIG